MRAAGRRRHERRAAGGAWSGLAGDGAWRDGQPCLRFGPGRGDACRRRHRGGHLGDRRRRRLRVDVQRAISAQGRAVGLSDGQRRGRRHDGGRGTDLRHRRMPHGLDRRGRRRQVRHRAVGAGCICRREPATRGRGAGGGLVRQRDRPGDAAAEEGRSRRGVARRVPSSRHDGREAGRAQAGVSERRHGDGRQRVGHQRRRRGAGRRRRALGCRHRPCRRWRASSRTRRRV